MMRTKRLLIALLAGIFVLCGCEKAINLEEIDNAATGNVTVNVYKIENEAFGVSSRGVVSDVCTRLNFAMYDAGGVRVKQINQKSGDKGFGAVSFELEEGSYQLVVLAHSSDGNPTMTNLAKIQFTNATKYSDTFLYYANVEVGDEPQTLDITLNRIVSLCRFVVNDPIPEGVAKLQFYYTGGSGAFSAMTGLGVVDSKQTMTFDVVPGTTGTVYDLYTFLHHTDDQVDLVVTALGADGNKMYERSFEVPMEQRKITRMTGNFFTDEASVESHGAQVEISINSEWEGEVNISY
ncbi:MAG: FimB/Mfa2 family fimbrial subunit [Prevotella sp.]|jgi:hypothetical protein|nr:FimB/Mfa2 family fimbrial subunit [Prevotella sp.]MBQ5548649.1 FimB/Mfa2 family fimbrial subunit [Prevotella sp.]